MFTKVIGKSSESDENGKTPHPVGSEPQRPPAPAPTGATQPAPVSPSPSAGGNVRNILSSDVEITGSVKFTNDLLVDGRIDGQITSNGNLTIGENAKIKAEIKTASVVVHGKVQGNITVTGRVELRAGAEVVGDIKAQTLTVEAGSVFVGKSEVGTPSTVAGAQNSQSTSAAKPAGKPAADAKKPQAQPAADQAKGKSSTSPTQGTLTGTDT